MNDGTVSLFFVCYLGGMLAIAAVSSWRIRLCTTPEEKKKWSDRFSVVQGLFVGGAMCVLFIAWKRYFGIPIVLIGIAAMHWLHRRFSFYCTSCGRHSNSQDWFSPHAAYHCPHCGQKLR